VVLWIPSKVRSSTPSPAGSEPRCGAAGYAQPTQARRSYASFPCFRASVWPARLAVTSPRAPRVPDQGGPGAVNLRRRSPPRRRRDQGPITSKPQPMTAASPARGQDGVIAPSDTAAGPICEPAVAFIPGRLAPSLPSSTLDGLTRARQSLAPRRCCAVDTAHSGGASDSPDPASPALRRRGARPHAPVGAGGHSRLERGRGRIGQGSSEGYTGRPQRGFPRRLSCRAVARSTLGVVCRRRGGSGARSRTSRRPRPRRLEATRLLRGQPGQHARVRRTAGGRAVGCASPPSAPSSLRPFFVGFHGLAATPSSSACRCGSDAGSHGVRGIPSRQAPSAGEGVLPQF